MPFDFDSVVNIAVLGPQGSGKTNLVAVWTNGTQAFSEEYRLTTQNDVIEANVTTNRGVVRLKLMDTVGQVFSSRGGPMHDGVPFACEGFILMFDLLSTTAYRELETATNLVQTYLNDKNIQFLQVGQQIETNLIPAVVLGGKCDMPQKVNPKRVRLPYQKGVPYFTISAKTGVTFEGGCVMNRNQEVSPSVPTGFKAPLLYLLKHITRMADLEIVEE